MKWKVWYRDQHDELQKCWTEASSKEEALKARITAEKDCFGEFKSKILNN